MTPTRSQNGWPVLDADQTRLWTIPTDPGDHVTIRLARGAAGFVLCHWALAFHETIEPLNIQRQPDDWGWAVRTIRGSTEVSNHASGTAEDLNTTMHPLGVPTLDTFTAEQAHLIRRRLARRYGGLIRWGGDYVNRPDAMHFELAAPRSAVRDLAELLRTTPRGKRIAKLNPPERNDAS